MNIFVIISLFIILTIGGCFFPKYGMKFEADDMLIKSKAYYNISKLYSKKNNISSKKNNIYVTSLNRIVLVVGQVENIYIKYKVSQLIRMIPHVKKIYNELEVKKPPILDRTSDSMLTVKIKHDMLQQNLPVARIKVITYNKVIYLMGIVTHEESTKATQLVKNFNVVKKIVKIFDYID